MTGHPSGPTVTDRSQADRLPTGHVHLAHVGETCDNELADIAGYCSAHFGYTVTRYPDEDAAVVHLFND
jgi:hypothetical protein